MKRLRGSGIFLFLCLSLVLFGCAPRGTYLLPPATFAPLEGQEGLLLPEKPLRVEYDPLPPRAEGELWVNGQAVSGIYQRHGVLYAAAGELASALKGSLQTPQGQDPRTDVMLAAEGQEGLLFSTQGEGLQDCLLVETEGFLLPCEVLTRWGYHYYEDGERRYYTAYPATREDLPPQVTVPVLMYHAVSDEVWGIRSLFVSPSAMEQQLQYLLENGYTPIFFEDLPRAHTVEKPVILTFDDGYDDNYRYLFPLLQRYGVKANIFLITDSIGKEHSLTEEQIRQMNAGGLVSFQSHTATHPYLDELGEDALRWQLERSKAAVARLTGREPFVLCYPSGRYNSLTLKVTKEYYSFALLMQDGRLYSTDDDPYFVRRQYVQRSTTIADFAALLEG